MTINTPRRAKRTGLTSIRDLAQKLCRLVSVFTPIIRRVFPDSPELHIALDAANAACAALVAEADKTLDKGV